LRARTLLAIANYLMVGAPIVCYALAIDKPLWIAALLGAAALSAYYTEYTGVLRLKGAAATAVFLGAFAYGLGFMILKGAGLFILALYETLIIVQIARLFQEQTRSGYRQMLAVALVHMAGCSLLTTELYFSATLFVYAAAATLSLMLRLIAEQEEAAAVFAGHKFARIGSGFVALSLVVTGITMVIAAGIFIVSPRVQSGFLVQRPASGSPVAVSGFSDSINLNDIGQILDSDQAVMYLALEKDGKPYRPQNPLELYMRGIALTVFDGKGWKRSNLIAYMEKNISQSAVNVEMGPAPETLGEGDWVKQDIILEPLEYNILFGIAKAQYCYISRVLRNNILINEYDSTISHVRRPGRSLHYYVVSDVRRPSADQLRADKAYVPDEFDAQTIFDRYIGECLDTSNVTARMTRLAQQLAPANAGLSDYEKADHIERYFTGGGYEYSLDLDMPQTDSPIDTFIFESKAGHCELYASAMALLARSVGIPARIVNGFKGGAWDSINSRYIIVQHHAHAWVEVYFRDSGWVSFDPTPGSSAQYEAKTREASWFDGIILWAHLNWSRYVVGFDRGTQENIYKSLQAAQKGVAEQIEEMLSRNRKLLGGLFKGGPIWAGLASAGMILNLLFIAFALVAAALTARALIKRFRPIEAYPPPTREHYGRTALRIVKAYQEILRQLKRRGFVRKPPQTPLEFSHEVHRLRAVGDSFEELTRIFCRARYGASVSPGDLARLRILAKSVRSEAGLPSAPEDAETEGDGRG